jgi:amidase
MSEIDRRALLIGVGAGVGAVGALAAGCASGGAPPVSPPGAASAVRAPHAELEEAGVADLAARMNRGETSAAALVDAYLARIDALDRGGPALRSILEVNPDARAIAASLDEERRARGPRGPLHGVPVVVKDNLDTGDRMQTTAGSLALAGPPAPRDAAVIARLRAAGAVLLGKTNLSEWANIRGARSTSGWSARGGLTRNPYALDRNTSGSSSGTAAAVAASLAAVGIGTETDGSIVSPSSICGLVGIKPTVGLLGGAGIVPISHSQDTAGPMARTVADAAALLGALAGVDYVASLDSNGANAGRGSRRPGLETVRLGVRRKSYGDLSPLVESQYAAALDELRALGAVLVDPAEPELPKELGDWELEVLLFELKADLAKYLAGRPGVAVRSLEDVVRFDVAHAPEELRWFGQELFEKALGKGDLDSPVYLDALARCRKATRDDGIDAVMTAHRLDALVAPTGGPAWRTDLVNGDNLSAGGSSSTLAAVAGYPSVTVPSGELCGLPLGISFTGRARSEATLLRIAYAYEQATRHRRPPLYRPTVDVFTS